MSCRKDPVMEYRVITAVRLRVRSIAENDVP